MMRLPARSAIGTGLHRTGWPCVVAALQAFANGKGIMLDDFVESTFGGRSGKNPYQSPWVGIFHYPVNVFSPLPRERRLCLRRVSRSSKWQDSLRHLRGAVVLAAEGAQELREWLNIPVLEILHPIEHEVRPWQIESLKSPRRIVQVGYNLRNTRVIYQINTPDWSRLRLCQSRRWQHRRDVALKVHLPRVEYDSQSVESRYRLDDGEYDDFLSTSVVITEIFGAAANNLVVECIVRGTPIVVNRLPALEQYLGASYPLFFENVQDVGKLVRDEHLCDTHQYLLNRAAMIPTFNSFAHEINQFVQSLED